MAHDGYVIVGTAGHIDHGKTALVRALTGYNTDKIKEERERGISIDIGFAPLALSDGVRLGLVDVPGHERFIRNMLAGACGMDLVLLVIDAREGIMPQTREHLAILQLLAVHRGLIVVTKLDLVDAEWLEMLQEELRSAFAGSFLSDAPILQVSSVTGAGIPELRTAIAAVLPSIQPRDPHGTFRMPVDRVFSVPGVGTVVTGTVWRGSLHSGDTIEIQPVGGVARVRTLQVHGEPVEAVTAGQRAAVALAGLDCDLERGMVIACEGLEQATKVIDVRIELLAQSEKSLCHRQRVRVYLGTAEVMGRVLLLDKSELSPGTEGFAQIVLEKEIAAEARDRFVIRTLSPLATIGGGIVIDPSPSRLHRRHQVEWIDELRKFQDGTPEERILACLDRFAPMSMSDIARRLGESEAMLGQVMHRMIEDGRLIRSSDSTTFASSRRIHEGMATVEECLRKYYERNRFDVWVTKSVLLQAAAASGFDASWGDDLLARAQTAGLLELRHDRVRLPGREPQLTAWENELKARILHVLAEHPFAPPSMTEMIAWIPGKGRVVKDLLRVLEGEGLVILIHDQQVMSVQAITKAEIVARELFVRLGPFSLGDFRDALGTSRKIALLMLEYFDRQKKTKRVGDAREYLL